MPIEKLFLNTLPFEYPTEPVVFYFSDTDNEEAHYTYLKSCKLFPAGIKQLFPNLNSNDTLYTSFSREVAGAKPLEIAFNNQDNYFLVKKYYNDCIEFYLRKNNLITDFNRYSNTYQAWVLNNNDNKHKDCDKYDRFSLKIDFDHFNNHPQIVLSFDRPTYVLQKSVAEILQATDDDPFAPDTKQADVSMFKRILYITPKEEYNQYKIDKYKFLAEKPYFNSENAYPIMNRNIATFLGYDDISDEQEEQNSVFNKSNRYKKYYNKIDAFYKKYLDNKYFREIFPIPTDGFSLVNPLQLGNTKSSSKDLIFGGGTTNYNPQRGVNNGPYAAAPYADIKIMCIYPLEDIDTARELLQYQVKGYKNFFKGIKQYTGKDVAYAPSELHLKFNNKSNPLPELTDFLYDAATNNKLKSDTRYVALYLTPISKHAANKESREIYYKVKEQLLKHGIVSQCVETQKMLAVIHQDNTHKDKKGNPLKNFAYTLQNMSIAINAKLGGTPWQINTQKQNELVVGVGAFKHTETNVQFIGSAFSFDNTGAFNSFEYFHKDELKELAGSIKNAIINFSQANGKPDKLTIHYYKEMSLAREYPLIEEQLHALGLDIPVYIVTVFKTESEDFVLFDGGDDNYFELMPYSGRYINLGNKTYLLCNNTRYQNATFNKWTEGFPFPVKIKIECPSNPDIDTTTITNLIDQVYQFSRIYWKSVKQQNLPVTIKYPEMIAQIAPHFTNGAIPETIENNNLWFL